MSLETQRVVRIFISSPGDVNEERSKAQQVIADLQHVYATQALLKPVIWEDLALPATASFQESIDYLLAQEPIDIAVFILWSRLGSPLGNSITRSDGTRYRSGTEREFDVMLTAFEQSGRQRPLILAYTRNDEATWKQSLARCQRDRLEEMISQQRLADSFIKEQFHDKDGHNLRAYHSYREPVGFAQRLRTHLRANLDELLSADATMPRWTDSPYRSLEVFDIQHAPIFFGRSEETCDVMDRLRKQHDAGCGFVVIVGASGSGKSSLARAGVAASFIEHAYDEQIRSWRSFVFIPGMHNENILLGLTEKLCDAVPEMLNTGTSKADVFSGLEKDVELACKLSVLPALTRAAEKAGGEVRLLIVLDQMEELWTISTLSDQDREQFLNAIEVLARTQYVDIVATLRSDFYAQAQASPAFLRLKGDIGYIDLVAPSAAAIQRMIVEPARMAGLRFERNERTGKTLDQTILEDATRETSALPLVQYALAELYDQRNVADRVLSFAAYELMGGVEGAIGQRATVTYARLPESTQSVLSEVLPLLVTVDSANEQNVVRRRASLDELNATPARKALTESLIEARFIATDREGSQAIAGLTHESLLRRWDTLARWVETNRHHLRLRASIEQARQRWQQSNNDSSLLLSRGLPLEEGRQLLRAAGEFLTPSVASYINASIEHDDAIQQRRTRQRASVLSMLSLLTILAIGGGIYSWFQRVAAVKQAQIADAARETAQIATARAVEQETLAKIQRNHVREQLVNSIHENYASNMAKVSQALTDRQPVRLVDMVKKARPRLGLTIDPRGLEWWISWNKAHGKTHPIPLNGKNVSGMRLIDRGTKAILQTDDRQLYVIDSQTGADLFQASTKDSSLSISNDRPTDLPCSDDGTTLAIRMGSEIRIYTLQNNQYLLTRTLDNGERVFGNAISKDGKTVVSASDSGIVRVWKENGVQPRKFNVGEGSRIISFQLSADGRNLAYFKKVVDGSLPAVLNLENGKSSSVPDEMKNEFGRIGFGQYNTLLAWNPKRVVTFAINSDQELTELWQTDLTNHFKYDVTRQVSESIREWIELTPEGKALDPVDLRNLLSVGDSSVVRATMLAVMLPKNIITTEVDYRQIGFRLFYREPTNRRSENAVFDKKSGRPVGIAELTLPNLGIVVDFSSDGKTALMRSVEGEYSTLACEAWAWECIDRHVHPGFVMGAAWTENHDLISVTRSHNVEVDPTSEFDRCTVPYHQESVVVHRALEILPSSRLSNDLSVLADYKENQINVQLLEDPTKLYKFRFKSAAGSFQNDTIMVRVFPWGRIGKEFLPWILCVPKYEANPKQNVADDKTLSLIVDYESSRVVQTLDVQNSPVKAVAINPNGRGFAMVCGAMGNLATGNSPQQLHTWSIADDRTITKGPLLNLNVDARCAALSPTDSHVAVGSLDGNVLVFDQRSGKVVMRSHAHEGLVQALMFSPDGERLITAGEDRMVRFFSARDWQEVMQHVCLVTPTCLAMDDKSGALAIGDTNGHITILTAATQQEVLDLSKLWLNQESTATEGEDAILGELWSDFVTTRIRSEDELEAGLKVLELLRGSVRELSFDELRHRFMTELPSYDDESASVNDKNYGRN